MSVVWTRPRPADAVHVTWVDDGDDRDRQMNAAALTVFQMLGPDFRVPYITQHGGHLLVISPSGRQQQVYNTDWVVSIDGAVLVLGPAEFDARFARL